MIDWLIQRAEENSQVAAGLPPKGLLSAPESSVYRDLYSEKRRKDWLLGRWTAKRLIQAAAEKPGMRFSNDEISILAAEDGAPEVWLADQGGSRRGEFNLSISHSRGVSLCAVTACTAHQLGADIEAIEPRSERFVTDYFSETEQQSVREAPLESRDCLVTAIWSGKEAALKAVRQGLRLDTRIVSCDFDTPFVVSQDWQSFAVQWREPGAPQLKGWWRVWQEFVLALVIGGNEKKQP